MYLILQYSVLLTLCMLLTCFFLIYFFLMLLSLFISFPNVPFYRFRLLLLYFSIRLIFFGWKKYSCIEYTHFICASPTVKCNIHSLPQTHAVEMLICFDLFIPRPTAQLTQHHFALNVSFAWEMEKDFFYTGCRISLWCFLFCFL